MLRARDLRSAFEAEHRISAASWIPTFEADFFLKCHKATALAVMLRRYFGKCPRPDESKVRIAYRAVQNISTGEAHRNLKELYQG